MIIKKNIVLFLLLMGSSFSTYAAPICKLKYIDAKYRSLGYEFGQIVDIGKVREPYYKLEYGTCYFVYKRQPAFGGEFATCPSDKIINPTTGVCEDSCKQMEGNQLGSVSFPEGTRDVVNICRNSCRAKSDMFFPAATPPYGIFTYTGESCDGSETGGGDTDGGDTGGGDTGGGDTGGGDTDGGDTGGGDTGGGDTGGGDTGGTDSNNRDGLTKGDIKDVLQDVFGKSESFTAPGQGNGFAADTVLTTSLDDLKTEIDELEETLESKLKQSPLKLGQMSFSDGSYESTTFSLSRWDVDVGFNLFSSLGSSNTNMIRTVILFLATLLAGFILLSSGRSKV
ncbi:hypothetical protein [Vibrio kanaloae]|uniref:hypothetical protein n=1 Tax=Vibrio kanaloae TaxID=170673 RepID=UPI0021C3B8C7|nr:hypothetical protein [Vibrio kanaloae]